MSENRFDPSQADGRWQRAWDEAQSFKADSNSPKPKSYVLEMLPYPSGEPHIGHLKIYSVGDAVAEELGRIAGLSIDELKKQRADRFYAIGRLG